MMLMGLDASDNRNRFTVKEVCAIMRAASNHGVTMLKFGELHIEFASKSTQSKVVDDLAYSEAETSDLKEQLKQKEFDRREIDVREEQIAFSIIEDPELAEKLIADGDLEDDDSAGDED